MLGLELTFADIYVPPEQVIDTVDLYFLKTRQRRLSLRFLSWFVLGEHIQQETHDSIEDARSALRLYNAFQAFEEQGIFDQKLEELYKEGRQFVRAESTFSHWPTLTWISMKELQTTYSPRPSSQLYSSGTCSVNLTTATSTVFQPVNSRPQPAPRTCL